MLRWAIIFFLVSVVAAVFGFTNVAVGAAAVSKVLFFCTIVLFLVFLIGGLMAGRAVAKL